jgi:hypothetical protein
MAGPPFCALGPSRGAYRQSSIALSNATGSAGLTIPSRRSRFVACHPLLACQCRLWSIIGFRDLLTPHGTGEPQMGRSFRVPTLALQRPPKQQMRVRLGRILL